MSRVVGRDKINDCPFHGAAQRGPDGHDAGQVSVCQSGGFAANCTGFCTASTPATGFSRCFRGSFESLIAHLFALSE
jgi:hypothetical protein